MNKKVIGIIIKSLLLTALITSFYYLVLLRPTIKRQETLIATKNTLTAHQSVLIQNRLAYVGLARLNPNSASFDIEKSDLVATLKKTIKEGIDNPNLPNDASDILQRQNTLLEIVFATKSYEEGVAILKSQESLELLTDQTNLLLRWQQEIRELEKQLE